MLVAARCCKFLWLMTASAFTRGLCNVHFRPHVKSRQQFFPLFCNINQINLPTSYMCHTLPDRPRFSITGTYRYHIRMPTTYYLSHYKPKPQKTIRLAELLMYSLHSLHCIAYTNHAQHRALKNNGSITHRPTRLSRFADRVTRALAARSPAGWAALVLASDWLSDPCDQVISSGWGRAIT